MFRPIAESSSARCFTFDRQCREEGFHYFDIASVMVEENGGLYTINLCENCYNL